MLPRDDVTTAGPAEQAAHRAAEARWLAATADVRRELEAVEAPVRTFLEDREIRLLPQDLKDVYRKPAAGRTPLEAQLAALIERLRTGAGRGLDGQFKTMPEATQTRWKELQARLAEYDALKPPPLPAPMVAVDVGPVAPPCVVPGEGNIVEPGFPAVLGAGTPAIPPLADSTGRRLALARWIASPANPLTPRVIVNRVWQQHFGTGLVATSSDFGRLGESPSHPELLDWLAARFVEGDWRLKDLHRRIMISASYRQAAQGDALEPELARRKDPAARSLWRRNLRRLDADELRDTVLSVTGELEGSQGGPSVEPAQPRRTVYTRLVRYSPEPLLQSFDAPDGFTSVPQRDVTTTATQALTLWNGAWSRGRATALAGRLRDQGFSLRHARATTALVERAYRLVLGRSPDAFEEAAAARFLASAASDEHRQAVINFCHVLLNANELIYVD
jgi:hypothetical protein